jgi:hypothetical protein
MNLKGKKRKEKLRAIANSRAERDELAWMEIIHPSWHRSSYLPHTLWMICLSLPSTVLFLFWQVFVVYQNDVNNGSTSDCHAQNSVELRMNDLIITITFFWPMWNWFSSRFKDYLLSDGASRFWISSAWLDKWINIHVVQFIRTEGGWQRWNRIDGSLSMQRKRAIWNGCN